MTRSRLTRPAIFGLCDGAMSILGVVMYAAGHRAQVFPIAFSGGLSAAVSMAGGEWLSESGDGLRAAAVMGGATLTGSLLPAVPYTFTGGWLAPVLSIASLAVVAYVVARLQAYRRHPYLETAGVLGAVLAVAVVCAALMPGGGG